MSNTITLPELGREVKVGLGWLPDLPDYRDYTIENENVGPDLVKAKGLAPALGLNSHGRGTGQAVGVTYAVAAAPAKAVGLAPTADLREYFSPIEDQRDIGSCTANAGVGLVEYFERRAFGTYIDASRMFLYKVTRNLLGLHGDTGAYLRTTMEAMVLFGVPPEEYWKYDKDLLDVEPDAFTYSFAKNYEAIKYFRIDPDWITKDVLVARIKTLLAAGFPSMFGFTVYSSIDQATKTGKIPFPTKGEKILGGHAIDAVGYDDKMKITNTNRGATETTGAFLIRNSWGSAWGDNGYGWLPYDYVLKGLAVDWWSLIKSDWVNTHQFEL